MISVFIAQSIDGFIADKDGGLDWLQSVPNPTNDDMGYNAFLQRTDAIIMGRTTFEMVCGFDIPWPYTLPVFVLSTRLTEIPTKAQGKAEIIRGELKSIIETLKRRGLQNLYIDGGATIHGFLQENLVDELIITTIPILLGDGIPLFRQSSQQFNFHIHASEVFLNAIVQTSYRRHP